RADFAPYGEELHGANLPPERFTGQTRDPEAGLDYFGARFYQQRIGRFSTLDPSMNGALRHPQAWNRYSDALNNPLKFVDPDGRQASNCTSSGVITTDEHGNTVYTSNSDKTCNESSVGIGFFWFFSDLFSLANTPPTSGDFYVLPGAGANKTSP